MNKYCIFTAQYLPSFGGVERYTYNLAIKLRERGHEVIIVTSQMNQLPFAEKDENGITIYRIPTISFLNGRLPMATPSNTWNNLKKILSSANIDRIIVQTRLYALSVMGMKFAKKHGIPCITIEHGTSFVGMSNPVVQAGEIAYEKLLLKYAKHYCRNFCTVSAAGEEWLKRFKLKTQSILYNSVNEKTILDYVENSTTDWRQKVGVKPSTKLVIFTGRLIREKGIIQLIDAVKDLQKKYDVALMVAGDGPLYEQLKMQCKNTNNIFLLGRLEQSDVMALLDQGNVFCLPSDSEGFPTSVLEAVVCKCFVATAPYGGAKEIISSEQYGKVMKDNTKESIYSCLQEILDMTDEEIKSITTQAYQHFLSGFTWDNTCDRLEALNWDDFI